MNSNEPTEAQINAVARSIAAAYWRGQVDATLPHIDQATREAMIRAAAEVNSHTFRGSARLALSK